MLPTMSWESNQTWVLKRQRALKGLLTDHDGPHFSIVTLHVVDRGWTGTIQKSGLCSAEWTGYSHLGLFTSTLRFLIKLTAVGNSPFGGAGSVLPCSLPLSPSMCLLTLLPGHCAHSLSVAISSKLHEAHTPISPQGASERNNICTESPSSVWMTGQVQKSLSLSTPRPPCVPSSSPLYLSF